MVFRALAPRWQRLLTGLLLAALLSGSLMGPAAARAQEPAAIKLVDEALISLGFPKPGRVIAANNLGSPVVTASKEGQSGAEKLAVSVYYFPDNTTLNASDWKKTLAQASNLDVGTGGWAHYSQNNSLRTAGSGNQQTWTAVGVGGVDFVCGGIITSVSCRIEGATRFSDQAQAKAEMGRLGYEAQGKAIDLAKKVARAFADRKLCAARKLPIIFLAGIAGSNLLDMAPGGGMVWPLGVGDRTKMALKPDGDTPMFANTKIEQTGIIGEGVYSGFEQALEVLGYDNAGELGTLTPGFYTFGYDWRLDNNFHVPALAGLVAKVLQETGAPKVVLIAHSMGGLIARAYVNTSGADKVDTLITINTPFYGAPKAYYAAVNGYTFDNVTVNQGLIKAVDQNWPAGYQLMPRLPFVIDARTNQPLPLTVSDGIRYKWFAGVSPGVFTKDVYTPTKDNVMNLNPALIARAKTFYKLLFNDDGSAKPLPAGVRHYLIAGSGVSTLDGYGAVDVGANEVGVEMGGRKVRLAPIFGDGDGTVPHWGQSFPAVTAQYWIADAGKSAAAGHVELLDNPKLHELVGAILKGAPPDPAGFSYRLKSGVALRTIETVDFTLHSDAHLAIVDEATGSRLGYNDQGGIAEDVSGGSFISMDEGEYASFAGLNRNVKVTVTGLQQGKFTLTVLVNRASGSTAYAYSEVAVQKGTVAQLRFNPGQTNGAPPALTVTTGGQTTSVQPRPVGAQPSSVNPQPANTQPPSSGEQPSATAKPSGGDQQTTEGGGPSVIGPYGSQPGNNPTPKPAARSKSPCSSAMILLVLGAALVAPMRRWRKGRG